MALCLAKTFVKIHLLPGLGLKWVNWWLDTKAGATLKGQETKPETCTDLVYPGKNTPSLMARLMRLFFKPDEAPQQTTLKRMEALARLMR